MRGKEDKRIKTFLFLCVLLVHEASGIELKIEPSYDVLPGSAIAIFVDGIDTKFEDSVEVSVDGKNIPLCGKMNNSLLAIYGVDLFRRGEIDVKLSVNGRTIKKVIKIKDMVFPVENLTLPPEKVFLSAEDLKRVEEEKEILDRIWVQVTPDRLWHGDFLEPAEGREGSAFGLRRIINGEERSPHTGRDIIADEGMPVVASNRGRIVWTGELFFGGHSIIIDHGLGLYSMYFHLSKIVVKEGEVVEKGQRIGLIGSTGRVSGPHLHWGIRLLNARIDPFSLKELNFLKEIK